MSGGKGGSQTTQVEIPEWLEGAAKANIAQGRDVSRIGYVPYYGPDVAAFTPTQEAAMGNTSQFAQAFGLQGGSTQMPQATDFGGGIRGYSSGDLYDRAVAELQARRPGQYQQIMSNFVDPYGSGGYQDPYANYFNQTNIGGSAALDDAMRGPTTGANTGGVQTGVQTGGVQTGVQTGVRTGVQTGGVQTGTQTGTQTGGFTGTGAVDQQSQAALNAMRGASSGNTNQVPAYVDNSMAEQYANQYAAQQAAQANQVAQRYQNVQGDIQNLKNTNKDWKGLSKEQKIRQVSILAKTKGYTAEDLAPVLNLPAATIQRYL